MLQILITGLVVSKPEESLTPNKVPFSTFYLAAKNGVKKDNAFFKCTYSGKTIPRQGSKVFLSGTLTVGIKEDESGEVFPDLSVLVSDLFIV